MYYVYELIDTRDDSVFYVGKGKGSRIKDHTKDAKKGVVGLKCDHIRAIWEAGFEVGEKIVKRFEDEDAAFAYERKLIARHGKENLTNIADGGRDMSAPEFAKRKEARALAKTLCRSVRILAKHDEVRFRFGGRWHDVPRGTVVRMVYKGIDHVLDVLGKSEGTAEFSKHNVFIENRA